MADVSGAVAAFALGGLGWVVTSFVGQPFRSFFDLFSFRRTAIFRDPAISPAMESSFSRSVKGKIGSRNRSCKAHRELCA